MQDYAQAGQSVFCSPDRCIILLTAGWTDQGLLKIPDTFYFRRGDPQFLTDSFIPKMFHRCITVRTKTFRSRHITFDIPDGE